MGKWGNTFHWGGAETRDHGDGFRRNLKEGQRKPYGCIFSEDNCKKKPAEGSVRALVVGLLS